jgi:hypothetical protein
MRVPNSGIGPPSQRGRRPGRGAAHREKQLLDNVGKGGFSTVCCPQQGGAECCTCSPVGS